jgi:hypothetical protein
MLEGCSTKGSTQSGDFGFLKKNKDFATSNSQALVPFHQENEYILVPFLIN